MIGAPSKTKKEAEAARLDARADTATRTPRISRGLLIGRNVEPKQSFGREKRSNPSEQSWSVLSRLEWKAGDATEI
jgi:hypothetical protein